MDAEGTASPSSENRRRQQPQPRRRDRSASKFNLNRDREPFLKIKGRYQWDCPNCRCPNSWEYDYWCPLCWGNGELVTRVSESQKYYGVPNAEEEWWRKSKHKQNERAKSKPQQEEPTPQEAPEQPARDPQSTSSFTSIFRPILRFFSFRGNRQSDSDSTSDNGDSDEYDVDDSSDSWEDNVLPDDHPLNKALPVLVSSILERFEGSIGCQQDQPESGSNSSSRNGGGQHDSSDQHDSQGSSQSRRRRLPVDDGEDIEGAGNSISNKKLKGSADIDQQTLACPFYKRDMCRYDRCLWLNLKRIKDVKQHLYREHIQPFYCPSCGMEFDQQNSQMDHLRARTCEQIVYEEPAGINQDQKSALSSRVDRKLGIEQQWFTVWDIVFCEQARPTSPWIHSPAQEYLAAFHDFCDSEGPQIISDHLQSEESSHQMLRNETDRAAFCTLVWRTASDRLFNRYMERYSSGMATAQREETASSNNLGLQSSRSSIIGINNESSAPEARMNYASTEPSTQAWESESRSAIQDSMYLPPEEPLMPLREVEEELRDWMPPAADEDDQSFEDLINFDLDWRLGGS